jgi:hypothetical protein
LPNITSKLKNWYTIAAVGLLTCVLLFLLLNLVLYAVTRAKRLPEPSRLPAASDLPKLYPGWAKTDVQTLLDETSRNGEYEYQPFTDFRERPFRGEFVNVDPAGFRFSKDQAPWPPRPQAINVFIFGGSTTFGAGLPDDQTIASYLQELAIADHPARPVAVYNFAVPAYFSSQELILFQQLLNTGFVPNVAVFIDGLNDFLFAEDQPLFAARLRNFMAGKSESPTWADVPMVGALQRLSALWGAAPPQKAIHYDDPGLLPSVVDRYVANKRMIELIADGFGVRAVFVWQPVPTYKYDLQYHLVLQSHKNIQSFGTLWRDTKRCGAGYPLVEKLRDEGKLGPDFLWLADLQQDKRENLYVDNIHYNAPFSKEIAAQIYSYLRARGWLQSPAEPLASRNPQQQ